MGLRERVTATGLALAVGVSVSVLVPASSWAKTDVEETPAGSDALAALSDGSVNVGGVVWDDYDLDGIRDPDEPGLAGVAVGLVSALGRPVRDLDGNRVLAYPTGGDGSYLFDRLRPGTYVVVFTPSTGLLSTLPDVGTDDTVDSDGPRARSQVLLPNQVELGVDAGFFLPAELGDQVWIDADGDGVQDAGEAPLGGVTATLYDSAGSRATDVAGTPVPAQLSGADGRYRFVDLKPGTYRVVFSALPAGYLPTVDRAGEDFTRDSDGLVTNLTTLVSGAVDLSVDLGLYSL